MANIELIISNINNKTYEEIILRKFFQMVFISPNGKKLTLYTATIFGGMTKKLPEGSTTGPVAAYGGHNNCKLKFQFISGDSQIKSITSKNFTKELWTQISRMERVWGQCRKCETQEEVNDLFTSLYQIPFRLSMDPNWPIYHIYDTKKQNCECVVTNGDYEDLPDGSYTLAARKAAKQDCIEVMNWVKTEITLNKSILGKHITFKISLDSGENHTYYTPDFTWYFAPPSGYHVDKDSAVVKIGTSNERNLVQEVSDETTLHLKEWDVEEQIEDRIKSRVNVNSLIASDYSVLSKNGGIEADISITNPQQHGNKQFFWGLLVAFLLSFCSDMTRLDAYYRCLFEVCTCAENSCACRPLCNMLGFSLPVLVLMTYLSLMFDVKRCVPDKKRFIICFYAIKILGFLATALLLGYIFGAWLICPQFVHRFVTTCAMNNGIIWFLMICSAVFNAVYIFYCMVIRKKKVFNHL